MRALVWTGPREMDVKDVPSPTPGSDEVLLEVVVAGICGSELSGYLGQNKLRTPPLIMGHEFTARVVAGPGLAPGERVVVNPLYGCGRCSACRQGLEQLCPERVLLGAHRPGAFAQFVTVPQRCCLPLPGVVDDLTGSLVEPLACGLSALELAEVGAEESLWIVGAGPIGLCTLAAARAAGVKHIVVTDLSAPRRAIARAWQAEAVVDSGAEDPVAAIHRLYPGGVDAVVDCVGSTKTRRQGARGLRPGGRMVMVGLHSEESTLEANHLIRDQIAVLGSFAYTPAMFRRSLDLVVQGVLRADSTWVEERDLAQGGTSFAELVAGSVPAAKIALRP